MKVNELVNKLNLTLFCGEGGMNNEITGGYTSDLLSDVMGNAEEGMVWITMQTHQNVIAVAALKDIAAVILVNGLQPDQEMLEKGNSEGVPILGTTLSAFELSGKTYRLIVNYEL
ncbi:serine kinase [Parabacteroides sp. OttesenSCG-928-G06]|nr:serine kinase [Parabacteroides sp. OttesenSCG-928-G06]